ncbi:MAG TPA: DUF418 domain-containing protein [Kiloniellales bacterium]|jgi:uncharacterized protein|nr:DUF418 domain-containing protein [Kiloniellales bacterium]
MQPASTAQAMVGAKDYNRIGLLDVLRGFAILGILLMNVQSFGMVSGAYLNPKALGEPPVADYLIWLLTHLLVDEKFIAILTMLFGAGLLLMAQRSKLTSGEFERVFRRRMLWLLAIGLIHGLLLWRGDILTTYAICGMAAIYFRHMPPWKLLKIAIALMLVPTVVIILMTAGLQLLPEQRLAELSTRHWLPTREVIREEVALYTGAWLATAGARALDGLTIQAWMLVTERFWRVLALMLIGMALLRIGFLMGQWPSERYRRNGLLALAIGLPTVALGVLFNEYFEWDLRYSLYLGKLANYWASGVVAFGWIALIAVLAHYDMLGRIGTWLTAVGRLALSNYLLQTLICATLFYGFGLGLYGQLDRPMLLLIVLGIWSAQVIFSLVWLKFFRVGPFEWTWRRLSARPLWG